MELCRSFFSDWLSLRIVTGWLAEHFSRSRRTQIYGAKLYGRPSCDWFPANPHRRVSIWTSEADHQLTARFTEVGRHIRSSRLLTLAVAASSLLLCPDCCCALTVAEPWLLLSPDCHFSSSLSSHPHFRCSQFWPIAVRGCNTSVRQLISDLCLHWSNYAQIPRIDQDEDVSAETRCNRCTRHVICRIASFATFVGPRKFYEFRHCTDATISNRPAFVWARYGLWAEYDASASCICALSNSRGPASCTFHSTTTSRSKSSSLLRLVLNWINLLRNWFFVGQLQAVVNCAISSRYNCNLKVSRVVWLLWLVKLVTFFCFFGGKRVYSSKTLWTSKDLKI